VPRTIDASKLLRPGLLDGVSLLLATVPERDAGEDREHDGQGRLAQSVGAACAELGARVSIWHSRAALDAAAGGSDAADARDPADPPDVATDLLVIDGASAFARQHESGSQLEALAARAALSACLEGAWEATRAVANTAFIEPGRAGRIVYLAPVTGARGQEHAAHVGAARAGLENLARTLSIEWARHGVTTVTIAPGAQTADHEIAALVAYLGSPAGAYFSGCLLDLTGPGGD